MSAPLRFQFGDTIIAVERTHEACGEELKEGTFSMLGLDQVHWSGWICPKHGEVRPTWTFAPAQVKKGLSKR